eukprot:Skav208008  [mRNA]  locus=scaffold1203:304494:304952:+ [translate_table: standard]
MVEPPTRYAERGIDFDQVIVWELRHRDPETYWSSARSEVRRKWEPRITWYNGIPVTAQRNALHNPVHRIHQLCRAQDFCAFKLDIDRPSIEYPLVLQLVEDPGHLKELFFEQHVRNPLMRPWWQNNVRGTYADSYSIFTSLRKKGVRAHSWT